MGFIFKQIWSIIHQFWDGGIICQFRGGGSLRRPKGGWAPLAPPELRREQATVYMWNKLSLKEDLPIFEDIFQPPPVRLSSRKPIWSGTEWDEFNVEKRWRNIWHADNVKSEWLIDDPCECMEWMKVGNGGVL